MQRFTLAIDIAAPSDRVWHVMSDVDRWHEWTTSITSITRIDNRPLSVGCRAVIRQPKFPPALWTVTSLDPGRGFTWLNRAPGLRVAAHHLVEPASAGSRVTLTLEYEGFVGGLLARMTRGITERYLALEAQGLKARSEDQAFTVRSTGA